MTSVRDADASAPHDPAHAPDVTPAHGAVEDARGSVAGVTPLELARQRQTAVRAAAQAKRAATPRPRAIDRAIDRELARAAKSPSEALSAALTAAGIDPAATTAARPHRPVTDDSAPTPHGGAAGERGNSVSAAGQNLDGASGDDGCGVFLPRKDARLRLRDEIQRWTQLPSVRHCEAAPKGEAVGVHLANSGRSTSFSGLVRCGSVWSCPPCAARVRAHRAAELERWALAWLEEDHGLYLVTLTVPHWEHVRLDGEQGQLNKLLEGWRGVGMGAWWVGRAVIRNKAPVRWADRGQYADDPDFPTDIEPREVGGELVVWKRGFKARWGIAGTTRTAEITDGRNGWHSHIHVLIWTETPATRDDADKLEQELYERWAQRCRSVKLPVPSRDRGVRVDPADRSLAGQKALARYIAKVQEKQRDDEDQEQKPVGRALASEMTRQDMKLARGAKGRTAFDLAQLAAEGHEWARERWLEYESATRGRRCLTWSEGLRERLAELLDEELDERDDDELANELEEELQRQAPDVAIARPAFRESIAQRRGGRADIVAAGDVGGLPAVLALLDRWGLVSGTDYWLPDPLEDALPVSAEQYKRGRAAKQHWHDRVQAADEVPLSRTVQQWAAAAEKRRATLAVQKEEAATAAADETTTDVELAELAAARVQFLEARRAATAARKTDVAAALARFRNAS
ncbi:hypothetical protein [Streptomyces rhizosphaericus]|uniref:Replication protein n=1 Tax=Streptomyces rhizosphaericus TaxID=114699 RepID=A0A6G4AWA3_9ACTN|nr:hypothetical protein [Streptomyces rhizosphaericus]NEW77655.1 hypothetical protein [Streptomyces rhizosphaericus]